MYQFLKYILVNDRTFLYASFDIVYKHHCLWKYTIHILYYQ